MAIQVFVKKEDLIDATNSLTKFTELFTWMNKHVITFEWDPDAGTPIETPSLGDTEVEDMLTTDGDHAFLAGLERAMEKHYDLTHPEKED